MQQRTYSSIREKSLACLKQLMPLLCNEGQQPVSTRADVVKQLVSNVTETVNQSAANQRTPHLLRTPQANGNVPAGQASLHSCCIPMTAFIPVDSQCHFAQRLHTELQHTKAALRTAGAASPVMEVLNK